MGKKPAQGLLLMVIVAAMMFGGGMVQEGRKEMWVDRSTGISATSSQNGSKVETDNTLEQSADMISHEMYIKTSTCPQAHKDF